MIEPRPKPDRATQQARFDAAYEAFAGQLDGSNARAEDAKLPWFMREDDDETSMAFDMSIAESLPWTGIPAIAADCAVPKNIGENTREAIDDRSPENSATIAGV